MTYAYCPDPRPLDPPDSYWGEEAPPPEDDSDRDIPELGVPFDYDF